MGIIISLTTLNGCMRAVDMSLGEQGGVGVVYDTKEPSPLLRKEAEQGDSQAQYNLGFMYHEGEVLFRTTKNPLNYNPPANPDKKSKQSYSKLVTICKKLEY
ncbi:hypothetical protein [Bathymodiolus japonicus methanotrophic gill symbiont]|uniref:hypothetical protein n=1 Tax=Bathymodiolus japonicus methanotrophic gill symbiont TaxID=113269 RepID=UPI001E2F1B5E|nr:hypothetical protein [Bathymodiolus japonicus methanotrophic gill symbiont]